MIDFQIRDEPQNRAFSSEMINFQRRDEPQNHVFSSEMIDFQRRDNGSALNRALYSEMIDFQSGFLRQKIGQKMTKLKEAARVAVPGRVADSLFRPHPKQRARFDNRRITDFRSLHKLFQNMFS